MIIHNGSGTQVRGIRKLPPATASATGTQRESVRFSAKKEPKESLGNRFRKSMSAVMIGLTAFFGFFSIKASAQAHPVVRTQEKQENVPRQFKQRDRQVLSFAEAKLFNTSKKIIDPKEDSPLKIQSQSDPLK